MKLTLKLFTMLVDKKERMFILKRRILPFVAAATLLLPLNTFAAGSQQVKYEEKPWNATHCDASILKYKTFFSIKENKIERSEVQNLVIKKDKKIIKIFIQFKKPGQNGQVQKPGQNEQVQKPEQNGQVQKPEQNEPVQKPGQSQNENSATAIQQEVVRLVNIERNKYGLSNLIMDTNLQKVAQKKSEDMKANNYFSHTSPTYGSPFDMMKQFGISYKAAGENIAKGQTSAAQVVEAWMNSAGHRANILSADYTHIGVGYVASGHYWTQMFIKK